MKKIVSAVSKISVASGFNIFTGVIRTKIFALILGTFGVGIISQLTNFNSLVLFISTIGIPLGVTKYVSEWEKEGKWSEINDAISRSISLLVLIGLVFFAITIIFSKEISFLILDSETYSTPLIIIASSIPFIAVLVIFEAFLRGLKKFNEYVRISIINASLTLIITISLVYFFNVLGFALSLMISSMISLLIYLYFFHIKKIFLIKNLKLFDFTFSEPFKSMFKLGMASLAVGISDQAAILVIRSLIVKDLGVDSNGIYQCVAGISNNYFMIFFMSLNAYIFPVLSEMKDIKEINSEINNAIRLTLIIIVPIIAFTFVLREYIILVLYSSKFLPASNLMIYNFIGDFFKALSWVLGSWLIPRSKIFLWLLFGVVYNVNYFVIYMLLAFFSINIKNVVIAYLLTNFIHFVVNLFLIKKLNSFQFRMDTNKLMLLSTLILGLILTISSYEISWGYFIVLPVILLWAKYAITKDEFFKFLGLIKLKGN